MKAPKSLKRGLEEVRRECLAGKQDRALERSNQLLQIWPDNPRLLILWARLVQMQDGDDAPPLEEAKTALRRSVELDPESPAGWLELGHFLNAVEDDAQEANQCFAKAAALSRQFLKEALLGQAQTLTDLQRPADALACVAEAYWLQTRNGKPERSQAEQEILDRLKEVTQG